MIRAIKDVYGVEGELGDYTFHGRTDPGIIRDLAGLWGAGGYGGSAHGDGPGPAETRAAAYRLGARGDGAADRVGECIAHYVGLLRDEIAAVAVETLPGVRQLVTALVADRRVLLGLLTGNVEEGARLKLEPTGLLSHFKVGAYGSDSALRSDLPAVAVSRAEALIGRRFTGKDIVVIGDSPADIECGASLGVTAVGVATGRHGMDELAACEPDHLLPDLSDWGTAYDVIVGEDGARR